MDHEIASQDAWALARRRECVLSNLPVRPSGAAIRDAMAELEVSRATIFRWLKRLRTEKRTSALLPHPAGGPSRMQPFAPAVLAVVERQFRTFYATACKPTKTRFWKEVAADCRSQRLPTPRFGVSRAGSAGKTRRS